MNLSLKSLSWLLLGSLALLACSSTDSSSSLPSSVKGACEEACSIQKNSCPDDPSNATCLDTCANVASSAAAKTCKSKLVDAYNCVNAAVDLTCNDAKEALLPADCGSLFDEATACVQNVGTAGAGGTGGAAGSAGSGGSISPGTGGSGGISPGTGGAGGASGSAGSSGTAGSAGSAGSSGVGGASGSSGASGSAGSAGSSGTAGAGGSGGIPSGWTCSTSYFGDSACDCNCGAWDVDCNSPSANSASATVYGCNAGEVCVNQGGTPACSGTGGAGGSAGASGAGGSGGSGGTPPGWTCDPTYYNDGMYCDCNCYNYDPDCDLGGTPYGCSSGQSCYNNNGLALCQ